MRTRLVILLLLLMLTPWLEAAAQELKEPLRIDSQDFVEFDTETGFAIVTNGVTMYYGTTTLSAKQASWSEATGEVNAQGQVRLDREGVLWTGEILRYNFLTGRMSGEGFKTGNAPFYASGDVMVADQKADVYVLVGGEVTTDDYAPPSYKVRAKSIVVVPGEYVEARNAALWLEGVPVMYLPYFRRSLKGQGNQFKFTPGYNSSDGPFLLTSYNWYWNDQFDGTLHLDGRLKRGVGAGPDFDWKLPTLGRGSFKSYYINDADPGEDDREHELNEDRYRIHFSHLLQPRTNMTVKGVVRYQSDSEIVRDFFESEFRENVQPSTYFEANQLWRNFSLDVYAQPRINDFFETVERLPEIQFHGLRQQIGPTPLYYESQSGAGYFQREFAFDATNHFSAFRADSYHEISVPWTFFNWLNAAPRVGGRFTHYSEAHGSGATTEEEDRWVFHTGMELTTKASRLWQGVHQKFFEVDGLRHIIEPSLNYAYIPDPSPEPDQLPQFDYRVPTTQLLPIDFPDFNDVDAIDAQNVIRFGLRNRLQTKRQEMIDDLVHWALFMDWNLHPESGQRTYSGLYSDIDLKPFSWLTLTSQNQYDINDDSWRQVNHMATFIPNNQWSLSVGQRYLNNEPALGPDSDYSLWFGTIYYKINENWGVRLSDRFNADNGRLEEQHYTLYRDLRSWTSAITLRIRKDEDGPTDVTAAITFSLKAYPRFGLGDDVNKPSLLFGN